MYTNRAELFNSLLPRTKHFLLRIYESYDNFVNATDPLSNKRRLLEEVCMLYDSSLQLPMSATVGLKLLGLEIADREDTVTPYSALYQALLNITDSQELMEKYFVI